MSDWVYIAVPVVLVGVYLLRRSKDGSRWGMERASVSREHNTRTRPLHVRRFLEDNGQRVVSEEPIGRPAGSLGMGFAGQRYLLESGGRFEHTVTVLSGPEDFTVHRYALVCPGVKEIMARVP